MFIFKTPEASVFPFIKSILQSKQTIIYTLLLKLVNGLRAFKKQPELPSATHFTSIFDVFQNERGIVNEKKKVGITYKMKPDLMLQ